MKITDAKVFVGGPGKNYVTLKIYTDEGIYGLGDASLNCRETLPAKYLEDYFPPRFVYQDFGPQLTMEFFKPEEIADIVAGAGAK